MHKYLPVAESVMLISRGHDEAQREMTRWIPVSTCVVPNVVCSGNHQLWEITAVEYLFTHDSDFLEYEGCGIV